MYIFCTICQDLLSFEKGAVVAVDCGHSYHQACIEEWIKRNRSCPICKAIIKRKKFFRLYFSFRQDDPGTTHMKTEITDLNKNIDKNLKDMLLLNFEMDCKNMEIEKLTKRIKEQKRTIKELLEKIEQLELRNKSKDLFEIIIPPANNRDTQIVYNHRTSSFMEKRLDLDSTDDKDNRPEIMEHSHLSSQNNNRQQNLKDWRNFVLNLSLNSNEFSSG